jgi:acyl-coenzyme A thioesterase PaaI-like protein
LSAERLAAQLQQFNAREEIAWFGFAGAYEAPGQAVISFARLAQGALGGGGTSAVNGGVIAAGFDAAFVLAGLGQYETPVVVTLELSVRYLSLALMSRPLAFHARVVRSSKRFSFVEGYLSAHGDALAPHLATASGMVAPAA